jgi:hypothetical protein
VERGAVAFEPADSASAKIRFIHRLLIHDLRESGGKPPHTRAASP